MTEVKSGYVSKCGRSGKSWKKRWFVLQDNGYLYYYKDKTSTKAKRAIDIVAATNVEDSKEILSGSKKFPSGQLSSNAFGIVIGERTFICACKKDWESQEWITAINKVRKKDDAAGGLQQFPAPMYPQTGGASAPTQYQPAEGPQQYLPTQTHHQQHNGRPHRYLYPHQQAYQPHLVEDTHQYLALPHQQAATGGPQQFPTYPQQTQQLPAVEEYPAYPYPEQTHHHPAIGGPQQYSAPVYPQQHPFQPTTDVAMALPRQRPRKPPPPPPPAPRPFTYWPYPHPMD